MRFQSSAAAAAALAAVCLANVGCASKGGNPADALFVVTQVTGPTTEAGGQASFSLALNARPKADVVVAFSSSNTGEGTIGATSLTFTKENFDAPQTVTLTGVNDAVADGSQTWNVHFAPIASTDKRYTALALSDIPVVNVDDDSAGITVSPASGATTEAGGTASFAVVLNSQPTADVTVSLVSDAIAEGVIASNAQMTFTSVNWNAPQTAVLRGIDDEVADGPQSFEVMSTVASNDARYAALSIDPIPLTNIDNDSASILVSPVSGPTTEAGGTATFSVVLASQPTADVTVNFATNKPAEGNAGVPSLTFMPVDYATPRTVTVSGSDDAIADGNQLYAIVFGATTSNDPQYAAITPSPVSLTNLDNETAGITIGAISGPTTEAGGTATFTVVLRSQPTAPVSLSFSSNDATEAVVTTGSISFTTSNYSTPQTVTIQGADDLLLDGNQPYAIVASSSVSADPRYSGLTPANVGMVNVDDDIPQKVLIVYSAPLAMAQDVQAKLTATGSFQSVGLFDAGAATPTLSQLSGYQSLLVFNSTAWMDSAALGNVVANFDDAGKRVVTALFADSQSGVPPIGGRFGNPANGYLLMNPASVPVSSSASLGVVAQPASFMMKDVSAFAATTASRVTSAPINNGSVVASWTGGAPLIVVGSNGSGSLVDLNFFPPSSAAQAGLWTGDGDKILRNALLYSGGATAPPAGGGGNGVPKTGLNVGYYEMSTGAGQSTETGPITDAGEVPVLLNDLTAGDLAGIKILFVTNADNSTYGAEYVSREPAIMAAVNAGMVLIIHDRATGNAAAQSMLPGGSGISFTRATTSDIQVLDNSTIVTNGSGPGGAITSTTLDGGTSSAHGYATVSTLPAGSITFLTQASSTQAVTFAYAQGSGTVIYSSIPLDYYLGGGGSVPLNASMRNYAANVIGWASGRVP